MGVYVLSAILSMFLEPISVLLEYYIASFLGVSSAGR